MSKENISIEDMKQMQFQLYEKNKANWNDMEPKAAKNHLLYMIEEIGECISIIKKKGIDSIMEEENIRAKFVEEFCDVLMYYIEISNRLQISSDELSKAYINKYEKNMERDYIEENKKKYEN